MDINYIKEKGKNFAKKAGYGIGALALGATLMTGSADASDVDSYHDEVLDRMNNQSSYELNYEKLGINNKSNLENELNSEDEMISYKRSMILDELRSDDIAAVQQYDSIDQWLDDMYRGNLNAAHYEQVIGNDTWIKQLSMIDGDDTSYGEMREIIESKYERALRKERRDRELQNESDDSSEVIRWRDLSSDEILERLGEKDSSDENLEEIVTEEEVEEPTPDKSYDYSVEEEKEEVSGKDYESWEDQNFFDSYNFESDLEGEDFDSEKYKIPEDYEKTEKPEKPEEDKEVHEEASEKEHTTEDDLSIETEESTEEDLERIVKEEDKKDQEINVSLNRESTSYEDNSEIYDTTGEGVDFTYDSSSKTSFDAGFVTPDEKHEFDISYVNKQYDGDMVYDNDGENEMEVGESSKKQSMISGNYQHNLNENFGVSVGASQFNEEKTANFEDGLTVVDFEDEDFIPHVGISYENDLDSENDEKLTLEGILDYSKSDSEMGYRVNSDYSKGIYGVNLEVDNSKSSERLEERGLSLEARRELNDLLTAKLMYDKSFEEGYDDMLGAELEADFDDTNINLGIKKGIDSDDQSIYGGVSFEF